MNEDMNKRGSKPPHIYIILYLNMDLVQVNEDMNKRG